MSQHLWYSVLISHFHRPPGGNYIPASTTVTPASPTVATTTATPAHPTQSGTISNCGHFYQVQAGDICNTVAMKFGLTFIDLRTANPQLDAECTNMWLGYDYCVATISAPATARPHRRLRCLRLAPVPHRHRQRLLRRL